MNLEGEAGEDILDIKNSVHTEAEWHECTQHARGVSYCPLCQVYQMDRMRSSICEGWRSKPKLGCNYSSTEFRIIQNYFEGKSFIANLKIKSYLRYSCTF